MNHDYIVLNSGVSKGYSWAKVASVSEAIGETVMCGTVSIDGTAKPIAKTGSVKGQLVLERAHEGKNKDGETVQYRDRYTLIVA